MNVDIYCTIIHETDSAYLINDGTDDENDIWVPRSQITEEVPDGSNVTLTMPEWLAEQKGLI